MISCFICGRVTLYTGRSQRRVVMHSNCTSSYSVNTVKYNLNHVHLACILALFYLVVRYFYIVKCTD
ncbi:hypothetical protein K450DRAFT_219830 [Umbelopsis ramanniana AG]|uniref:Uncharacterized protein n=1 Tax=Umbelopsis ramanniana AG TaxID=1314678 RepID=A0AAD5HJ73_UMBRA|nr:uncharacterized protein K450DRAFT_219830 [Umbelopsis ramanniana AG]KAI8584431.1 hypothetical protein K450DRAFT_219830 [Umbelopsis ramanniana AG]